MGENKKSKTVQPEQEKIDYAALIKDMREKTGLSQSQFADYFDLTLRAVQCWEIGQRKPTKSTFSMMKRLLIAEKDPRTRGYWENLDTAE